MKTTTFNHLKRLRDQFGPGIFGKIAQKLLALAFYDIGFHQVVERGVQGVDIDIANGAGDKYALEVKTTDAASIPISRENIEALEARTPDGYLPVIAALRMQMFEDWVLASIPLSQLRPGSMPLSRLRGYRMRELEKLVQPSFESIVEEHGTGVASGGERYLIRVLGSKRPPPA